MKKNNLIEPEISIIQINYKPNTNDPGRVFRSMAGLIEAFVALDRDLAHSIAISIEPEVFLERVEAGSIRAILRTVLHHLPDESLLKLDWKPLLGQFLVKGKHLLLRWTDGRPQIQSREEVIELQQDLVRLAPPILLNNLLPPAAVPVERLLWDMEAISRGVQGLQADDTAMFISVEEETRIETGLRLSQTDIEALLTQEVTTTTTELPLLVKKPDYLGNSRWEFRFGDHAIEAKISDEAWLNLFRNGAIVLKPGDALRARVRTEISRGFENNVVTTRYEVLEVLDVLHGSGGDQGLLIQ